MKTIATIATTLLLSLGLLVSPASAEEPVPTPVCAPINTDGTDLEMALTNEVKALRVNLSVVESNAAMLKAQRDLESKRADKLQIKVDNNQATIDRLRAKLLRQR